MASLPDPVVVRVETEQFQLHAIQTAISEMGKKLVELEKLLRNHIDQRTPAPEPRCLIGTPICKEKLYCWNEYATAVKKLNCPVLIVDTSKEEDPKFVKQVQSEAFQYYMAQYNDKPMNRIVTARNMIFNQAISGGYDYVLFIDSDVIVPPDTVTKLLNGNRDCVAGFYPITNEYGFPIPHAKHKTEAGYYVPFEESKLNGAIWAVSLVGLGCTLISRKIFSKYKFRCERGDYNSLLRSEDMCFCEDLRKDHILVWFDSGLVCRHIIKEGHWDYETA